MNDGPHRRDGVYFSEGYADAQQAVRTATQRWGLWLGVGNGAGLTATANAMLERINQPIAYLLMPTLWLFAFGLLAAASTAWARSYRGSLYLKAYDFEGEELQRCLSEQSNFQRAEGILSGVSAAFAASAILYPLVVLSARYLENGRFT